MENNALLKTNILVSVILVIGFALTTMFGYQANYKASLENIERVSSLTTEGIYYQLTTMFTKPVNISLTMSNDRLLKEHLLEEATHLDDEEYIQTTKRYLQGYRDKYGFDSVFLVSDASGRYYNFNGLDRVITREEQENVWYYNLLDYDGEYLLVVDNDEVYGADNAITVFVNCKITDSNGDVLGAVGVGMRIDYLKELLNSYEERYNIKACLIDENGYIEVSTTYTGYENINWFKIYNREGIKDRVLNWKESIKSLESWVSCNESQNSKSYIVTRYIPELSWHLVIEQDTGKLLTEMRHKIYKICILILFVIISILIIITAIIRNFNKQITKLIEEKQTLFRKATEQLYDNIYEINITKNCYVGKRTEKYFESLGAKGFSYDKGLHIVAQKQIKKEHREGYISTFKPENIINEYQKGNNNIRYDFMITQDGLNYSWMRIDAYIFHLKEEDSIHMFVYRKNIDDEKEREIKSITDEMTGFYSKKTTEDLIKKLLVENPQNKYAFFIFDIDNFKQANDTFGHAFGDLCIQKFTQIIKKHFDSKDILGRIGGDEFVVFSFMPSLEWLEQKAKELSCALNTTCKDGFSCWNMSASIGIAVSPEHGSDFEIIYKNADVALYKTKEKGKNGFTIYSQY